MKQPNPNRYFSNSLCLAGVVFFVSCGGEGKHTELPPEELIGDVWSLPSANRLGGLPGQVYESQESSLIHWQPWTKASLEMAQNSRRLILAVIAMPQQPSFDDILKELASDPAMVSIINDTYVPVLIDGDAVREMGILTADLCAEIGSALQLPLMVWMTSEANPVAWLPLPSPITGSSAELFSQSHLMVARTWEDDPNYVLKNSRLDQSNRRQKMIERIRNRETSKDLGTDALRSIRQLTSLYDPLSRTFDEAGGLFPSGALDLLAMGAGMENLPEDLRRRCRSVLGDLVADLVVSPMFDPLDGGVFSARRGSSWAFPSFYRDCAGLAQTAVSLLNSYEVTGDRRALNRALGAICLIGENYRTGEGLYVMRAGHSGDIARWLWRTEDLSGLLTEEERTVWILASGMKDSGNIPSEADPLREYFRGNTIAFAKSAEQVALEMGLDVTTVEAVLDRARQKLLEARNKRLNKISNDEKANAVATFRMVTAYATAYRVTGEIEYRNLAKQTLTKAKDHFADGPRLKSYVGDSPPSLTAGRAFLYGVAIQAALDFEAVTLEGTWLLWAGDLSSTVSELFSADGLIKECPATADLIGLPITDEAMLFDESTLGLLAMSESRLEALGIPLVPSLKEKVKTLPMAAISNPILYSDLIQAALMREFGVTYVLGKNAPDAMRQALTRSPLKGVNRRETKPTDTGSRAPKNDEVFRIAPCGVISPVKEVCEIKLPSLPSSSN